MVRPIGFRTDAHNSEKFYATSGVRVANCNAPTVPRHRPTRVIDSHTRTRLFSRVFLSQIATKRNVAHTGSRHFYGNARVQISIIEVVCTASDRVDSQWASRSHLEPRMQWISWLRRASSACVVKAVYIKNKFWFDRKRNKDKYNRIKISLASRRKRSHASCICTISNALWKRFFNNWGSEFALWTIPSSKILTKSARSSRERASRLMTMRNFAMKCEYGFLFNKYWHNLKKLIFVR